MPFMQPFSADAIIFSNMFLFFFALEKIKKHHQKLLLISPELFFPCTGWLPKTAKCTQRCSGKQSCSGKEILTNKQRCLYRQRWSGKKSCSDKQSCPENQSCSDNQSFFGQTELFWKATDDLIYKCLIIIEEKDINK